MFCWTLNEVGILFWTWYSMFELDILYLIFLSCMECHTPAAQIKAKPRKAVENTLRKCSSHNTLNFTATRQVQNEQWRYHPRYYDDSHIRPPHIPPRTHSLNKIDRLENVQLQVLSDWNYPKLDTRVERQSRNPYQPLIIPPCNATGSEYQSLTQFRQCQRAEAKM